jgi:FeS assembly SUF system protein
MLWEHDGQVEVIMETVIIEAEVIEALRSCFDPEIPVNIFELGLIYDVKVDPSGAVGIRMTLTSPSCPAAQSLPAEVQTKTRGVRGVTDVTVDVVWDPPWEASKMSEAAKLQLGFM